MKMKMKNALLLSHIVGLVLVSQQAQSTVIQSISPGDFTLVSELIPRTLPTTSNITSNSGDLTLQVALGVGDPEAINHFYGNPTSLLDGNEYIITGDENFNVLFNGLQTAFAFDYVDVSVSSSFTLGFFNGSTSVGSASFTTTSFGTKEFIGFMSNAEFDQVQVREDDGGANTNEFFQFYTASASSTAPEITGDSTVPELSTLGMLGVSLSMMGVSMRRRKVKS